MPGIRDQYRWMSYPYHNSYLKSALSVALHHKKNNSCTPCMPMFLFWHRLHMRSARFFFPFCFFTSFTNQNIYFEKVACRNLGTDFLHRLLSVMYWNTTHQSIECQSKYHSGRAEMWCIRALSTNILSDVLKSTL